MQRLPLCHAAFLSRAEASNHFVLALYDRRQIDAHIACLHAPACRVSRIVSDLRGGDHGLGGCAPSVDTRPPEMRPLHQGDVPALIGQAMTKGISALTRSNHDGVEFHEVPSSTSGA